MNFIPYARQEIGDADIDAVAMVLRSDWLTQGPAVERFEQAVAQYCGAAHAVAVNSATSALHLACLALGVGPGDLGWTTPNTFVASANCLLHCGASVDFVDIEATTLNIDVAALEAKLIRARNAGRLPKVVIPVHFAGHPCDMAGIRSLADEYGFKVVEDASHAVGARCQGRPVGSGAHADLTVFSFHPVKIMTTGEGGMVLSNDAGLIRQVALLRSHGITRDPAEMEGQSEGGWYYQQIGLGYNYRMTDIQAALGTAQLSRLDDFLARRRSLARRYDALLADLPLNRLHPDDGSAWHLYPIRLHDAARRRQVFEHMRAAGIGVNVHYIPVHLQPWYRRMGFKPGDFPAAEAYYAGALTLPLYPGLSDMDQERVVQVLRQALI
ncbi:MAG TPA: UDP-4-amino-4,6-dideoxy-N-acetyl-beta-L-altrosamine transaminase [Thiobacillaceae bacterium]|nr:UDP-4-amino-4,6-dideoxy-N-acetyl-beta-L-altrosamine transaminase [Thiobacillaceae bacterium]HNU65137.1 UDP-4-amino-4,6-dideoxy-N-acetyl-beta-L-altrosamine transaminase [Thiobacillaceae bacterium]